MSKKIYNLESNEGFEESKIIFGNPSGIINFNRTNFQWAYNIYSQMEGNQWFPQEANVGQDKNSYNKLPPEHKDAFDLCIAQLITNDSIQTNQLLDSINGHITSPVVNAAVALQAYQEANHSRSYAVMVEELCEDQDYIYNLHKHNKHLARKNNAVAKMYEMINSSDSEPEIKDLQKAFAANQILEELVFPGGFVTIWSMGKILPGSANMISFIERDEATHVALFRNIFLESVRQEGLEKKTSDSILKMIEHMTNEEKIWTKYITRNLLGFSEKTIDMYIENQANSVCKNLKLPLIYELTNGGPLYSLVEEYSLVKGAKSKANFFEKANANYSIGTLDEDY